MRSDSESKLCPLLNMCYRATTHKSVRTNRIILDHIDTCLESSSDISLKKKKDVSEKLISDHVILK